MGTCSLTVLLHSVRCAWPLYQLPCPCAACLLRQSQCRAQEPVLNSFLCTLLLHSVMSSHHLGVHSWTPIYTTIYQHTKLSSQLCASSYTPDVSWPLGFNSATTKKAFLTSLSLPLDLLGGGWQCSFSGPEFHSPQIYVFICPLKSHCLGAHHSHKRAQAEGTNWVIVIVNSPMRCFSVNLHNHVKS